MKTAKRIILAISILAVLIIGASCIVVTQENQYSLVRQFGKIDHVVSEAGISFKLPFIQTVDTLPKQTLLYDLSPSDVITSDKKTMICDSYILWHITDPVKFADPERLHLRRGKPSGCHCIQLYQKCHQQHHPG